MSALIQILLICILGTLEYLAPEILSNTIIYDAIKSDIYSLGILLFVMLFKALPFSAENCEDVIEKMDVSEKAKELIKNMLNKDSDKRLSVDQILDSDWLRNDD
jgi:serine/threonine protein kinase